MILIPGVQSLQPGLPHPDVEFSQQKDRSGIHDFGPFSDFYGRVPRVACDRVVVLLEIMGKVQTLGFDSGQSEGA
jgi:hypothetical protein